MRFLLLLIALPVLAQTFEEAQDAARTELARRQALIETVFPSWQDAAGTNPPMTTPLPTTNALVRGPASPALVKRDGLIYVTWNGMPRSVYFIQARNLTSQSWKTVSPQFPAALRVGYPFQTNAHKYFRIQEGGLSGTNFTFKVMATLTNK